MLMWKLENKKKSEDEIKKLLLKALIKSSKRKDMKLIGIRKV